MCFVFFFSSRRRHTRLQGDWSSDVCSSDLWWWGSRLSGFLPGVSIWKRPPAGFTKRLCWAQCASTTKTKPGARSEERRVGKECRASWEAKEEKRRKKRNEETADAKRAPHEG